MGFSALLALTLTPALCATMLKPHVDHADGHERRGFFGWFNRLFNRTTQGYKSGVTRILRRSGMYLVLYAVLIACVAVMFVRLPSGFLPDEDQGYFVGILQLPPGATQERTVEVLSRSSSR